MLCTSAALWIKRSRVRYRLTGEYILRYTVSKGIFGQVLAVSSGPTCFRKKPKIPQNTRKSPRTECIYRNCVNVNMNRLNARSLVELYVGFHRGGTVRDKKKFKTLHIQSDVAVCSRPLRATLPQRLRLKHNRGTQDFDMHEVNNWEIHNGYKAPKLCTMPSYTDSTQHKMNNSRTHTANNIAHEEKELRQWPLFNPPLWTVIISTFIKYIWHNLIQYVNII